MCHSGIEHRIKYTSRMKKSDIFWQSYLSLEKELIEVSKFIYIADEVNTHEGGKEVARSCDSQLMTFSPHIADLLIRCCVQVEAISKELYYDNGGAKLRGDSSIYFDEDCLKLVDIKWATHNKRVMVVAPFFNLTKDENRILRPLKEAHKRAGTYWEKAYQAVKHDRLIAKGLEKEKLNPANRFMHLWELGKYRLRKLLPDTMPFEERKLKLLGSEAWNCWINQNNQHLSPDEITAENIEQEIDVAGRRWGMDIEKRYKTLSWLDFAFNKAICRVYIP